MHKTTEGNQYSDKDQGVIEIKTKFLKLDDSNSDKFEVNIYTMDINYLTNEYKDVSVNGKNNLNSKGEDPNGGKIINDVMTESCRHA